MSGTPSISGYLGCLDPITSGWPLVECLDVLASCCQEVVVVDGGSSDGSREALEAAAARRPWLKLHRHLPATEPDPAGGAAGRRGALLELRARARSLCQGDFCWLVAEGEVLADDAMERLVLLAAHWPAGVAAVALPCVEIVGDPWRVRLTEAGGRPRLSRNDPALTHDVPRRMRRFDRSGGLLVGATVDLDQLVDRTTHEPARLSSLVDPTVQSLFEASRAPDPAARLARARLQVELNRLLDQVPCLFDLTGLAGGRLPEAEPIVRCGKLPPAGLEAWVAARLEVVSTELTTMGAR